MHAWRGGGGLRRGSGSRGKGRKTRIIEFRKEVDDDVVGDDIVDNDDDDGDDGYDTDGDDYDGDDDDD